MSVRDKGALITWTTGRPDGPPVLLLHDRYLDHDANDGLGQKLAATHRVISARGARTQMAMGAIKGYYWHLGPLDEPELSTLGDALSHLERLLIALRDSTERQIFLVGTGEGGSVALLVARLWPELVAGVVSIDGPIARNMASMPLNFPPADGLRVLLVQRERDLGPTSDLLQREGAAVELAAADDAAIVAWLREAA